MISNTVIKKLKSLRSTIYILICLACIFILGVIIPQKDLLGPQIYSVWKAEKPGLVSSLEFIGFTDIHTSPISIALWCLFFLNLIFVMSNRVPSLWKKTLKKDITHTVSAIKKSRHYEAIEGRSVEDVRVAVKKMGYRFFSNKSSFWAVKNRFSPLATILFHLSFILLLTGILTSFYTRFRAETNVGAGETFTGQYRWVQPPKIGSVPKTTFTVEEIKPTYYKKSLPIDLKVKLRTMSGKRVIGINKPYKEGALSFVIIDIDIMPFFIIKDEKDREVEGANVKLQVLGGKIDSFRMLGYEFEAAFFTDYTGETPNNPKETANLPQVLKQTPMTREETQQPKEVINPAFDISVFKDDLFITHKIIKKGEYIEFNNHRLFFEDLNYWVKFYVGKEHGLGILYAGFTLMVLALIIRFLFYRRDIKGVIEQNRLYISGRGEFYPALFEDEFKTITNKLKS